MKKFLLTAVVLCVGVSQAHAAFIWNVKVPDTDHLRIKLDNFEYTIDVDGSEKALVDKAGDEIRGIFVITSIADWDNSGNVFWSNAIGDSELTGFFDDYIANAPVPSVSTFDHDSDASTPEIPTDVDVSFYGGNWEIYYDTTPDFSQDWLDTGDFGNSITHGKNYSDGVLWLRGTGVGGILSDLTVTLDSSIALDGNPMNGTGAGYITVDRTAGLAKDLFSLDALDPGGIGATLGDQDLLLRNTITVTSGWIPASSDFPVTSGDPIEAYVPEPASMAIWGFLGLVIAIVAIRRKKS